MELFEPLKQVIDYLDPTLQSVVQDAFKMADRAHHGQFRRSGEPYIMHPVAVAKILAKMRMDHQTIVAGLLHDTIEDTSVTKAEIKAAFCPEIADIVDGVTKLKQVSFHSRQEAQAEYLRKMLLAMSQDIRVILVKLADRLHNMRTLGPMPHEKRRRISKETLDIYAPLAKRLGMNDLTLELEDHGFRTLYPLRYRALKAAVAQVQGNHANVLVEIKDRMSSKFHACHLQIAKIDAREKHLYSIYRKMRDKHLSFSELTDVYAIRVVVHTVEDCYLALCHIHQLYKPVSGRFKDYIALPKANGYQSLHTVLFGPHGIPIEVQIRTVSMSETANSGVSAHWAYKSKEQHLKKDELSAQQWIKELIEIQQQTGNSAEFLENVRINLVPDDVYVFTPKGDIIELPLGATALDLAYTIHTDLGNTCVAAKVNRQLVPLSHALTSGVTVEIITSSSSSPSVSWLNFVVTPKAKSCIRYYFKTRRRDQSLILGRRLLESALYHIKLDVDDFSDKDKEIIAAQCGMVSFTELLMDIGLGNRAAQLVVPHFQSFSAAQADLSSLASSETLAISGTEGMVVEYASCCYPIPGDPIFGVIERGSGMMVHQQSCKKLQRIQSKTPEHTIPVCWSGLVVGEFRVRVAIYVQNSRGVLATMALAIADQNASIEDIDISLNEANNTYVVVVLSVKNRKHLADIIKQLRRIKATHKVQRLMR